MTTKMKHGIILGCVSLMSAGVLGAALFAQGCSANSKEVAATSVLGEHVVSVSSGYAHTIALTSQGCVYGFGYARHGQVGNGTDTDKTTPTKLAFAGLASGETVVSLKTGGDSSFALTSSRNVYSWGYNYWGQLGDGTNTNKFFPGKISFAGLEADETIIEIGTAKNAAYALTSSGNVYSWGDNTYGELGDGTTTSKNVPTKITIPGLGEGERVVALQAKNASVLALTSAKSLYAWGDNSYGQLGDGTIIGQHIPEKISLSWLGEGETIQSFGLGGYHSFMISSTGDFYDCGNNGMGQLGDGTKCAKQTPSKITFGGLGEGETIVSASFGDLHSLALSSSGKVYAWGNNDSGQIGDGTTSGKLIPTIVSFAQLASEETITSVSAGDRQSYCATSKGNLFAWGDNSCGQLGNETKTSETSPVASEISPDYIFAANLFGYKTCTEYDAAFSALSSDFSALSSSQISNLASISYQDYPTLSESGGSYNYAGSSKSVMTTASAKWAAIVSLHQAAPIPSAIVPSTDSASWETLSLSLMAIMAIGAAGAYCLRRKKE